VSERGEPRTARILAAVAEAAEELVRSTFAVPAAEPMLEALGVATEASRSYLFTTRKEPDGAPVADLLLEWVAEGVEREVGHDLVTVEVEDPNVFETLQIGLRLPEALRVHGLHHVEVHLVGDELVDALVPQLLKQSVVGELGIGRQHQDRPGTGEDQIRPHTRLGHVAPFRLWL